MSRIRSRRPSSEGTGGRRPGLRDESGQTLAEYAVLVAAVAVACLLAGVFLAAGIGGLFGSSDAPPSPGPFVPPSTPQLAYPSSIEDCERGRWRNYAQFASEAQCKEYVESRATRPPGS